MPNISASVGIASGRQCYNATLDQQIIQDLLDRIPLSMGGRLGETGAWAMPKRGYCAPDLHQAILRFQTLNRGSLPYGPDGHVDPAGSTLALMNRLNGVPGNGGTPSGPAALGTAINLDDVLAKLDWAETNWEVAKADGATADAWMFHLGYGTYCLKNVRNGKLLRLSYTAAGCSRVAGPLHINSNLSFMLHSRLPVKSLSYGASMRDVPWERLTGPILLFTNALSFQMVVAWKIQIAFLNPPNAGIALVRAYQQGDMSLDSILRNMIVHSGGVSYLVTQAAGVPNAASTSLASGWSWAKPPSGVD
ncbi:MAG: hypothetical protein IT167_23250 [Bryobacterales bacterium]|nr:hypothetical protein [Bryobacterales bacterium]